MNQASKVGSASAIEPQHKSNLESHSNGYDNSSANVEHQQDASSDRDLKAQAQPITSCVLYENTEEDVFLVDIPTSISLAQGQKSVSLDGVIFSSLPQEKPFISHNEPSSSAAKGNAAANTVQSDVHNASRAAILDALSEIQMHHEGSWCLPRRVRSTSTSTSQKRKADNTDATEKDLSGKDLLDNFFKCALNISAASQLDADINNNVENAGQMKDEFLVHGSLHNPHDRELSLAINQFKKYALPTNPGSLKFLIPPRSTFLLGDCNQPIYLHNLVRRTLRSKHFSLILLDPPWPNASVKRKHAYSTSPTLADLTTMLTEMSLETMIAPGGFVAVWITNKPAIRTAILSPGGLFDRLNIDLIEEWLWIKTTIHGEPVSPLDSSWRKPYEVLLIARAPGLGEDISAPGQKRVRRRVIVGVPDLHSRKPCLKELFERVLLRRKAGEYEALEIFARYCVAGWWSWGNEVMKYNWEGYWADP